MRNFIVWVMLAMVCLRWDANTESDLAGYKAYHNGVYVGGVSAPITTFCSGNMVNEGSNYYNLTAYNTSDLESSFSNTVTLDLPYTPVALTGEMVGDTNVTGPVVVSGGCLTIW